MAFRRVPGALLAIADQGLVSCSAFASGVLLARFLSYVAYADYVVLTNLIATLSGVLTALVWAPLRVFSPSEPTSGPFTQSLPSLQLSLALLLSISAASLFACFASREGSQVTLILAVGVFVFLALMLEYARAVLTTRLIWGSLFLVGTLGYGTRAVGLVGAAAVLDASLDEILYMAAAVMTVALMIASWKNSLCLLSFSVMRCKFAFGKTWGFGKWLLFENLTFSLSVQFYALAVSAICGAEQVAHYGAAQQIVNAFNVVLLGASSYALSGARRSYLETGYSGWSGYLTKMNIMLVTVASVIGLGSAIFAEPLLTYIYGTGYMDAAHLVPCFAAVIVLGSVNATYSVAFRTTNLPQIGFWGRAISAVLSMTVGVFLIRKYGAFGAAVGLGVSQVTWLVVFIVMGNFHKQLSEQKVKLRMEGANKA